MVIVDVSKMNSLLAQIAKRRSRVPVSKSPGVHLVKSSQRTLKHLALLPFSCIKRILDITDTGGWSCFLFDWDWDGINSATQWQDASGYVYCTG